MTMASTAALRALLSGDARESAALAAALSPADTQEFDLLMQAAVAVAARRLFAPAHDAGDIVRYVARLRMDLASEPGRPNLDPRAAEAVLRRALGEPAPAVADLWTRLRTIAALLTVFVSGMSLGNDGIDVLISEARGLADRWLTTLNQTE